MRDLVALTNLSSRDVSVGSGASLLPGTTATVAKAARRLYVALCAASSIGVDGGVSDGAGEALEALLYSSDVAGGVATVPPQSPSLLFKQSLLFRLLNSRTWSTALRMTVSILSG